MTTDLPHFLYFGVETETSSTYTYIFVINCISLRVRLPKRSSLLKTTPLHQPGMSRTNEYRYVLTQFYTMSCNRLIREFNQRYQRIIRNMKLISLFTMKWSPKTFKTAFSRIYARRLSAFCPKKHKGTT